MAATGNYPNSFSWPTICDLTLNQLGGFRGPTDIRTIPDALLWTDAWVNMYWSIHHYIRICEELQPGAPLCSFLTRHTVYRIDLNSFTEKNIDHISIIHCQRLLERIHEKTVADLEQAIDFSDLI